MQLPNAPLRGLVLEGRVVIGRRPFDTILVPDPTVSRIHAWIGKKEGRFHLYDAGSRTGSFLNGKPVVQASALQEGDEIRIGPATLTFLEGDELPVDAQPLESSPPPPATDPYDGGIYFDCTCGGPMWVTGELAGAAGRCRYCGQRLVVPHKSGQTARLLAPLGAGAATPRRMGPVPGPITSSRSPGTRQRSSVAPALAAAGPAATEMVSPETERTCSICQTRILPDEVETRCPSCHLTFHRQCWEENHGCSAYGCDQVNVLAPAAVEPEASAGRTTDQAWDTEVPAPSPTGNWDLILLALSFVALGLGALAFGAPSVIMLGWTGYFLLAKKPARRALVVLGLAVSIVGAVAGLVTSMFLFQGTRLWEMVWK